MNLRDWWVRGPFPYRRYMRRHHCVFVHVPKVAGTSVLQVLSGLAVPPRDHCGWRTYYQADRARFEASFKFAFVRNPWDRAASVYNYLAAGGNGSGDLWFRDRVQRDGLTFARFVTEYLNQDRIHQHLLFMPQYGFLVDHEDRLRVDFLGRYETLAADFGTVATRLGLPPALPHANSAGRGDFRTQYTDPALVAAVARLYRKDIELFGYAF